MNRTDLQTLSQLRLQESQSLHNAGHHCGAYYLAGYAVECALKAAICKQVAQYDFPDKDLANKSFTHRLIDLLGTAGLKPAFDQAVQGRPALAVNWNIVKDWSENSRYRHDITQAVARDLIEACAAQPDGVHSWLTTQW